MSDKAFDAVIVPGDGLSSDGSVLDTTAQRLDKAAAMLFDGDADAIITCGANSYKTQEQGRGSEAQAYAKYLGAHGVPDEKIFLETESQDTLGNILFVKTQILMPRNWRNIVVIPTQNHSVERIAYILRKVLGPDYNWRIERVVNNDDPANTAREAKSLELTRELIDQYVDGDHVAISTELLRSHPAYGGTRWTIDELRSTLS